MTFDAVLLDLYDTVVWSDWRSWQRLLAGRVGVSLEVMGTAFDDTRPARSTGRHPDADADLASVLMAAGVVSTPDLLVELNTLEAEALTDTVRLYDDSLEVLRQLRARGVPTALVSNCSWNTRPIVDRLGLEREFDTVVLSFEVGAMKPQPAIYLEALRRLGDPTPSRSVFVDDQVAYCDGARAVGLDTRLILRPEEALEGRPTSTNGHAIIDTLMPVLD
ncbi:MAG TPA: HAD-IA family hydrolase [Actinomycetota bacterium]